MGAENTATIDRVVEPPEDDEAEATAEVTPLPPTVHRLRDLDRRGRLVAVVFALALVLAPVVAFIHTAPDWAPAGDPALMSLRVMDVGTSRTPVSGQPSTSAYYVDEVHVVTHPGPIHFYVMALPVRLLGAAPGMIVVSLLITASCLVLSAWAAFRQLGPPGGVVAAVVLGGIAFTTGISSLMNPVSSNIAGYPLLCSMVLLWCLLCGDYRLLPLAAVVVSFAGQQHLSSVPTLAIAFVAVGAILVVRVVGRWRSAGPERSALRRRLRPWVLGAGAISAVLWVPVLIQQFFGNEGNISALIEFTQHDDRPSVGFENALHQMAHVLGLPPLLGRPRLTGMWLLSEPSLLGWISAVVVLAAVVVIGVRARRTSPARAALLTMVVILIAAGLFNGSSVPAGIEQQRLPFYHWMWPLTFFVVVGLALAVVAVVRDRSASLRLANRPRLIPVVLTLAVLTIVVPTVVNPSLDRNSNTLSMAGSILERRQYERLADQIMEHEAELGDQTLLLERGRILFEGFGAGLAVELLERGVDMRFPRNWGQSIHSGRMVRRDEVTSALMLVVGDVVRPMPRNLPGKLVASLTTGDFDIEAFHELVTLAETAETVRFGPELQALLDGAVPAFAELAEESIMSLPEDAAALLHDPTWLRVFRDYPLLEPQLDPVLINRVLDSLDPEGPRDYELQVYLLDRDEVLDSIGSHELGRR